MPGGNSWDFIDQGGQEGSVEEKDMKILKRIDEGSRLGDERNTW